MPQWFSWPQDIDPPTTFEIVWGLAVPLGALIFDPIVFHGGGDTWGHGLLSMYRIGGYLALGGSILVFTSILVWPPHSPGWRALAAGLLFGAAITAGVFGLIMAPFSILGLLFVIGILGVVPFLAAAAYGRVARRLLHPWSGRRRHFWAFCLGLILILVLPHAAEFWADRRVAAAIHAVINGPPDQSAAAVTVLRSAFWCPIECYDPLIDAYLREGDPQREAHLERAYEEITGSSLLERRRNSLAFN
jgi:hypothetical protein